MSDDEFKNNYKIDHVVPLSSFDLSIPENQFIAFNLQNCSPLLKSKNRSKGAKRDLWSELMQDLKVTVFFKNYIIQNTVKRRKSHFQFLVYHCI